MSRDVFVTFLITAVLGDEMKVVTTNDNSALHLVLGDDTAQDTTTNRDVRGERALLVNVGSFDGLKFKHLL